ncbi:MAG: 3-oxoacyl-ACP synthase III family protein [Tatlockia sp.]|nr:3-oxoacyl-ACP synthase III family protein [Tatlockia sp.]
MIYNAELAHVVSFLPEKKIINKDLIATMAEEEKKHNQKKGYLGEDLQSNPFFKGVAERRFASPEYSSVDLGERVVKKLLTETGLHANDIDLILCSCVFTDTFWPGIASAIQAKINAKRCSIINIDTSCASFLTGVNIAKAFIESGKYKNVVMITVTNFISRLTEFQKSPRSFVLGDGATAALIKRGKANIIASYEHSFGEHYGLMRFEPDFCDKKFYNYWERNSGPITVNFDREMIDRIRDNAMDIVPRALNECFKQAHLKAKDIQMLITHQPNTFFLEKWRDKIGIQPPRAYDTLAKYGNLFQGSLPVTLADAIEKRLVKTGDLIALATFSNGGDFASAMIMKYISPFEDPV